MLASSTRSRISKIDAAPKSETYDTFERCFWMDSLQKKVFPSPQPPFRATTIGRSESSKRSRLVLMSARAGVDTVMAAHTALLSRDMSESADIKAQDQCRARRRAA